MHKSSKKYVPGRTVAVAFASIALSVFALLLWGKLKLVTGVPRTAYAVPEGTQPKPHPADKSPSPQTAVPAERSGLHGN